MLLKVLDENRVKILMEEDDIDLFDLPFEKLNYDDPYSRSFILDLFDKTYEQTGVDFKNSRVMIEVVPGVSKTYYILLSKMANEAGEKIEFDKAELSETEHYIFRFGSAEQVLSFLNKIREFFPQKSEVYYYNSYYYMVLYFLPSVILKKDFGDYLRNLDEFGERCRFKIENEGTLAEWGVYLGETDIFMRQIEGKTPGK